MEDGLDLLCLDQLESDCEALVDGLIALCIAANIMVNDTQCGHQRQTAYRCLVITFRVLVCLTHGNESWCRALVHHDFTLPLIMRTMSRAQDHGSVTSNIFNKEHTAQEDGDAKALDLICLALGLLTNLIQVNEEAKDLCREIRKRKSYLSLSFTEPITGINPTCPVRRDCLQGCRCMRRVGGLEFLALIYIQQDTTTKVIDPEADFLRGHLAVLFGLLMQQSDRHQEALLQVLPGESNYIKLNSLVNQAREFVTFYAELTTQLMNAASNLGEGERDDLYPDLSKISRRTHNSIGSIGRIIRDGGGEDVASEIILYLEQLRGRQSKLAQE